ncbi:isochorismatase family protein [Actinokineospora sp. NPDC004072]
MAVPVVEPYDMSAAAKLPRNTVDWRVDARRAVLVIHDMQDRIVASFDGSRSPAVELVHNVGKLRDTCRDAAVPIAYTLRGRQAGQLVYPPRPDELLVDAGLGEPGAALRAVLDAAGRDQLVLVGVRAHAACLLAAGGPSLVGAQVFAVADAIADLGLDEHRRAVRAAAESGAMTTTTSRVIGELLGVLS